MGESRQYLFFHMWEMWHVNTVEFYQLQMKIKPAGKRMELDNIVFALVFHREPEMP